MNELLVAKQVKKAQPVVIEPGDTVTTWKCYQRVAKTLRLIGAHLNMKQEAVLELFADDFENYLVTLQAQDMADRKKQKGE